MDDEKKIRIIDKIIEINSEINKFWKESQGWAPISAAKLLSKSRLDRQVSLVHCLKIWIEEQDLNKKDGSLILAWTNLGSLVEGTMKLVLSIWYETYKKDINAIKKKGKLNDPDCLPLESLKQFYKKSIWEPWKKEEWNDFVEHIQYRRNAIHSFKHREIGDFEEFFLYVQKYLEFLEMINRKLPYP